MPKEIPPYFMDVLKRKRGNSLVVQRPGLSAFIAVGPDWGTKIPQSAGRSPGWGTRIPQSAGRGQKYI